MKCATAWTRQTLVVASGPRDDVDNRGGNVESLGRGQGSQTDLDGKLGAVFPKSRQIAADTHQACTRIGEKTRPMPRMIGPEAKGEEHFHGLPQQFLSAIAEQLLDLSVHQLDDAVLIDRHETDRRRLDDLAVLIFQLHGPGRGANAGRRRALARVREP